MNERDVRAGLDRVLTEAGFERAAKSLRRRGSGVWTVVELQKGFGQLWHINIGFRLEALGGVCPRRVEQTHLYFRLERLFPAWRETITTAGALDDQGQARAFEALLGLLDGEVRRELLVLASEHGLSSALASGRLSEGLIRKEARNHLLSIHRAAISEDAASPAPPAPAEPRAAADGEVGRAEGAPSRRRS